MPQRTANNTVTIPQAQPWGGVPPSISKYAITMPLPPYPVFSNVVTATIRRILLDLDRPTPDGDAPLDGETLTALAAALAIAAEQFVNEVRGTTTRQRLTASEAFSELGLALAVRRQPLSPLLICLATVVRRAWQAASGGVMRQGWQTVGIGHLGNAAFTYVAHLERRLVLGYQTGVLIVTEPDAAPPHPAAPAQPTTVTRRSPRTTDPSSDEAADPAADGIVVMRVAYHGTFPDLPRQGNALILGTLNPALVVAPAAHAESVAQSMTRYPGLRVAMSWPVPLALAATANQWARRALDLVDKMVIPRQPIIRCEQHTTQLWLHSEPELRRDLVQQHLAPLLAEGRNSREILGETLLAWTSGRDRAPAIAAHLGVHPHTVRYRLKRLNDLFGDAMHDPEFVGIAAILLRATVPLWKAGDETDVLEYRARHPES